MKEYEYKGEVVRLLEGYEGLKISARGTVYGVKGNPIGTKTTHGYLRVPIPGVRGKSVFSHRLVAEAWVENESNLPFVDHKNGIKDDNRAENLRWVKHRTNDQNREEHRNGKLVGAIKVGNRWKSCYWHEGRNVNLGRFDTAEEAHAAYLQAVSNL